MHGDAAYYARREQEERSRAAESADGKVRDVHLMLAEKYAELAKREAELEADVPGSA